MMPRQKPGGFFRLEMLWVVILHILLYYFATDRFVGAKIRTESLDIFSESSILRYGVTTHYIVTGRWPKDVMALPAWSRHQTNPSTEKKWRFALDEGVIEAKKMGKMPLTLTLRPAVLEKNATGPLMWVCGRDPLDRTWRVQGTVDTKAPQNLLPRGCRPPGSLSRS